MAKIVRSILVLAAAVTGTVRKVKVEKIPIHTSTTASGPIGENCSPAVDGSETVAEHTQNDSASDEKAKHPLDEAGERIRSEPPTAADDHSNLGHANFGGKPLDTSSVAEVVDTILPKMPLMSIENELLMCSSEASKVAVTTRQTKISKSDDCTTAAVADKDDTGKTAKITNQQRVRAAAVPPADAKGDQGCKTQ